MTEHDTPSTALVRMAYGDARCTDMNDPAHANGCPQDAEFDRWLADHDAQAKAEVLAQVREGLKDSRTTPVPTRFGGYFTAVWLADALAVVDRLEGKP